MKTLSKSQYVLGLQCHKALWLYRHRKDLKAEFGAFQQGLADAGTEFGILARDRFSGGVLIDADHDHPEEALAQTKAAIDGGARILYEAAFLHDDVLVRVDILVNEAAGWALVEVKSGTDVEEVHLHDVAIQLHIARGAGFAINKAAVAHANPGYVRRGALNLHQLFKIMDVTETVRDALELVPGELAYMKKVADGPEAPPKAIGGHCAKPYECSFKAHCWAHVPEYSVFNLAYAKIEKKLELFNSGVQRIDQINPDMHKLTPGQKAQVEIAKLGRARVDMPALAKFLATLTYPRAFLDFETDPAVVPPYDGLRPYQQLPFQASVRVQKEPGAPLTEHAFLGDGLSDPRAALADFLVERVGSRGAVVAYHKSFEGGRLEETAGHFFAEGRGDRSGPLKAMAGRLWDLADPFRTGIYVHPAFRGRWSIKAVLPVLVPELTYKGLEVADGTQAMAAYAQLKNPKLPKAERARLTAALKVYCGLDTEAMVKILEHLEQLVAGQIAA